MYACVCVCARAHAQYIHTYIHACIHVCMHAYIHACMHAYKHTHVHTCMHACMHTNTHTYIHVTNINKRHCAVPRLDSVPGGPARLYSKVRVHDMCSAPVGAWRQKKKTKGRKKKRKFSKVSAIVYSRHKRRAELRDLRTDFAECVAWVKHCLVQFAHCLCTRKKNSQQSVQTVPECIPCINRLCIRSGEFAHRLRCATRERERERRERERREREKKAENHCQVRVSLSLRIARVRVCVRVRARTHTRTHA
jgi:hypothetical protein